MEKRRGIRVLTKRSPENRASIKLIVMTKVTQILNAVCNGEAGATNKLFTALYDELRRMAASRMANEASGQTLQTTALVNEAYLRLIGNETDSDGNTWENRYHFFAAAAEAMRRILIEAARSKKRLKRGGDAKRVELRDGALQAEPVSDELLDLDAALLKLEKNDPKKAELVKLRFFGGLTNKEAAEVLNIGLSTAERYWTYARAWLKEEMKTEAGG